MAANINAAKELDFSDNFLVVRDGSKFATQNAWTTGNPLEMTFQFVGTSFTKLRERPLKTDTNTYPAITPLTRQSNGNFLKTFIDQQNVHSCIVLNLYVKSSTEMDLVKWDYGNILIAKKIVKTDPPPYITFAEPTPRYAAVASHNQIY